MGGRIPEVDAPAVAGGREQRAVVIEGDGQHRPRSWLHGSSDAVAGAHRPELDLALPPLAVETVDAVRVDGHREHAAVRAESDLPDGRLPDAERRADFPATPRIEKSNVTVDRSDGDQLAVGLERNRGDDRAVVDPESLAPGRSVVHDRAAIEPAR